MMSTFSCSVDVKMLYRECLLIVIPKLRAFLKKLCLENDTAYLNLQFSRRLLRKPIADTASMEVPAPLCP